MSDPTEQGGAAPDEERVTRRGWGSLAAVLTVQTQNAFNDNVARFALLALVFVVLGDDTRTFFNRVTINLADSYKHLAAFLISIPFVLLAPFAGWLSDRFSKRSVLQVCLYGQVAIIFGIVAALLFRDIVLATFAFFLLAVQSAFFSPAKMGILKELVGSRKLSVASGWLQMLTIMAIIFGQVGGSETFKVFARRGSDPWDAAILPILVIGLFALFPLLLVRKVQRTPARGAEPLRVGLFFRHFHDVRHIWRDRPLFLAAMGVNFFWFAGAFFQLLLIQVAREAVPPEEAAAFSARMLAAVGGGVALGSFLVSIFSWRRIELGLVPLGNIGMALAAICCAFVPVMSGFYLVILLGLGMSSAFFLVPQNAFLQDRADPSRRGRVLSASNLLNSLAVLAATGLQFVLENLGLGSNLQFIIMGVACLLAAYYVIRILPGNLLRFILLMIIRIAYRVRPVSAHNVPSKGGALMFSNHVTWMDALLIGSACPREVRFVAAEGFFRVWWLGCFLRAFGVIPISQTRAREAIRRIAGAVTEGSIVCIFPEGQLTRTGVMNELQKGIEMIAGRIGDAPVLPVYLDSLWGSIFSFAEGKFFFKKPQRFPYPVIINFAPPISTGDVTRETARLALLKAGCQSYTYRPELRATLARALIKALKKRGRRSCVIGSGPGGSGVRSGRSLLAEALYLAGYWKNTFAANRVGVVMPPGAEALMCHLSLALAGKTPVALPLADVSTVTKDGGRAHVMTKEVLQRLKIAEIVTTEKTTVRLPDFPWPGNVHLWEDLPSTDLDRAPLLQRFQAFWFPAPWLGLMMADFNTGTHRSETEAVGIVNFSLPQGSCFLSHRDLLSNVSQIGDANIFLRGDSIRTPVHLYDVEGWIFGLWLPLLRGVPVMMGPAAERAATVLVCGAEDIGPINAAWQKGDGPSSARMIITFEPWRKDGVFRDVESRYSVPVCHGYAEDSALAVLTMSMPHPIPGSDNDLFQAGMKEGAAGRLLPGVVIESPDADEDGLGELLATIPGTRRAQDGRSFRLSRRGRVDSEGFAFFEKGRGSRKG